MPGLAVQAVHARNQNYAKTAFEAARSESATEYRCGGGIKIKANGGFSCRGVKKYLRKKETMSPTKLDG